MERKYITVTELCKYIKDIFVAEEMLHNIAILGEVSGLRISGAHSYFNLKDSGGVIACSCFQYRKTYIPKEGESVILIGTPDFYAPSGRLSLVVSKIEPVGIGLLYQRIEELRNKLAAEGVFDDSNKIPIPKFCDKVVVVTSKNGAVIRDIYKTIRRKNPKLDIYVKDVKVQGEYASMEIAMALKSVDRMNFDCVILARGGGSLEDLLPFYDENVVRAVFNMKTPIISAVGHETDFSLCDFAADARAATPTAAGELVAYDYYKTKDSVFDFLKRANVSSQLCLNGYLEKTKYLTSNIANAVDKQYNENLSRLEKSNIKMSNSINNLQKNNEFAVEKLLTALEKMNPVRILKSGYFCLYDNGNPVTSVKNVNVGDKITVKGADGSIYANVTDIVEEEL